MRSKHPRNRKVMKQDLAKRHATQKTLRMWLKAESSGHQSKTAQVLEGSWEGNMAENTFACTPFKGLRETWHQCLPIYSQREGSWIFLCNFTWGSTAQKTLQACLNYCIHIQSRSVPAAFPCPSVNLTLVELLKKWFSLNPCSWKSGG